MDWYLRLLLLAITYNAFEFLDRFLIQADLQNPYYAVHALHNALIVWSTAPEVWATFTDFYGIAGRPPNDVAAILCFALHFYHISLYRDRFRFDDWLHHGLMIGIALPLGLLLPSSTFLGFSLFFTTGLPGGIDYALLFGVRNGWIERMTEKRINRFLQVWIRSPGAVALATLSAASALSTPNAHWLVRAGCLVPAALNYWNGQYFMEQVVADHAQLELAAH